MTLNERDRREISELASSAADGRITPGELARLEELLLNSPDARAFYVRFMDISAGLSWAARGEPDLQPLTTPFDRADANTTSHSKTQSRGKLIASVAAAVLLAATLGTWALLKPTTPTTPAPLPVGIATLSTAMNVEWADALEPNHVGNMLKPGWVRMKSGLAQIDFLNGTSVWLEGPVEFRLDSSREAYCASGKLVAQVPHGAGDFRLAAPYLSAIEKATGFGIEVSKGSCAAIHVFRGTVEVTLQENRSKTELGPGQAMTVDHAGTTSMMSADPGNFSREEFAGPLNAYRPFGGPPPWMSPEWTHSTSMGQPPVLLPGQWKGADPMDPVRDLLGADEKRWAQIRKPLEDFLSEQWKTWGLDTNFEEKGVSRAKWNLKFVVEDPNSTDEEIAKSLQVLRDARAESRRKLAVKEIDLRCLLTDQEQGKLVSGGYIP